jgi:hypothetical protein
MVARIASDDEQAPCESVPRLQQVSSDAETPEVELTAAAGIEPYDLDI